ncbi:hypothetical protein [Macrococcus brunensis]|uniref:hypothetical protein n=1 Tax=Macrococcus brunensis TaxID=198483 RepID=UPI001EF13BF5|nr:hypothetical protein [Macrococcus brunensis]ULG72982.1 hypothetical protein MGG12_05555 [Macrococcus brunensis]
MTAFNVGDKQTTRFNLAGFKFEKQVIYQADHVVLIIRCVHTEHTVINTQISDIEDYYCQLYSIRNDLNQYIIDYMSEQERLYAHLNTHAMNHELID